MGGGLMAQPVIQFANVLGGSGSDMPAAVTIGPGGYIYITGLTTSADFPNANRLSASHDADRGDVFVGKVDPTGARIVYSVVVGAAQPVAMAVNAAGEAFVAGAQTAADFPVTTGALSTTGDCFLLRLDAAGSSLKYSTKLSCQTGVSLPAAGLAIDAAGNAYLTGSGQVLTTPGVFSSSPAGGFVMKVNPQGTALVYSTYVSAEPKAIAVDAAGDAYLTASAGAKGFPATVTNLPHEPFDPNEISATADVFVLKLNADGTALGFATLFGGYGTDVGLAIMPDSDGAVYVAVSSQTTTGFGPQTPFPTTAGAIDRSPCFPRGFLAKLSPAGDALMFSTFLPETDAAQCISINNAGVDEHILIEE